MNYWKQLTHVMKYWRAEEDPNATLPKNFISGFLEVCQVHNPVIMPANRGLGSKLGSLRHPKVHTVHSSIHASQRHRNAGMISKKTVNPKFVMQRRNFERNCPVPL